MIINKENEKLMQLIISACSSTKSLKLPAGSASGPQKSSLDAFPPRLI